MASDWPRKRIGELGRVVTGKTPSTRDQDNFGDAFPFITIPDLASCVLVRKTERWLSEKGARAIQGSLLPPDAVMMSCIATVGRCGITTRPSFTNQQINSLICGEGVSPRFVCYCFAALGQELEASGSGGSVYTNVSKSRFSDLTIPFPPQAEQRAIACILGSLDDKIELNRRMNETLEGIARAIFKSWFVDFDPVRAKAEGRDPGLPSEIADLFPSSFVDSELGPIPEGWEVGTVGDFGSVVCGKTPPTVETDNYGGSMPFVTIPDMHDRVFVTSTRKSLSNKGARSQSTKTLPAYAVCVSCIASPGIVTLTSENCQTNQQINSVVPAHPSASLYCFHALRELGREILARGSGGSVVSNLNKSQFEAVPVLMPPTSLLEKLHNLEFPVFERMRGNELQNAVLASLRDSLLPKLISGELRVPDAERIVGRCVK